MTAEAHSETLPSDAVRDAIIDGVRLRHADSGEGPAVLLIHGLGGSWQNWAENVPALGCGHRVVAVDLPGFGASEPLVPPGDAERYVALLAGLLDRLGIEHVVVVGHSLGGLVATQLAETHPERVRGLVLVSAGSVELGRARLAMISAGFGFFDTIVRRTPLLDLVSRHPHLRWLFLRGAVQEPATLRPELALQVIPAMRAPGFADAVAAGLAVVRLAAPVAVRCPTVMIWGRNDRLVPLASAHALRRRIPHARLAVLDDVGHCAMFEWPAAFNQIVLEFLDELDEVDRRANAGMSWTEPGRLDPVAWFARPRHTRVPALTRRLGRGVGERIGALARLAVAPTSRMSAALHQSRENA